MRLPICGPEVPIRVLGVEQPSLPAVRAVLFGFSGPLFQIGTYADRIRAALDRPVSESEMGPTLDGLETP